MTLTTKMSAGVARRVAALAILMAVLCGAWASHAGNPNIVATNPKAGLQAMTETTRDRDSIETLILIQGKAEIIDLDGPVSDIMVANPSIADVTALKANRLYVVGAAFGSTNLIALDDKGNIIKRMNIHVKMDDETIQRTVNELFPGEDVHIRSLQDQVVMTGRVSSPLVASNLANIVSQYAGELTATEGTPDELIVNLLKVSGGQQVMLKVKVVEASRAMLRELGIGVNQAGGVSGALGVISGSLQTATGQGLTKSPLGLADVFWSSGDGGIGPINLIIGALEQQGLANTLAEPNLTATSGEQAGFLAGGEVPVPTGRDQNGNILIDYHPFGVALNFKPTVLAEDRMSLQISTEVSAISNERTIQGDLFTFYSFNVRRASTTVEMGSGGSLMIAGLLQSDVTKTLENLPGVRDLPIIGDLMSSKSFLRQETELVVIVTAYLAEPYADKSNVKEEENQKQEGNPLADAFFANINRAYSKLKINAALFGADKHYGYLIQ